MPRCHSRYFTAPPAVARMSTSGAFEASTSAAVVPRPARASGVRASVAPNSEWVRLSKMSARQKRCIAARMHTGLGHRLLIYQDAKRARGRPARVGVHLSAMASRRVCADEAGPPASGATRQQRIAIDLDDATVYLVPIGSGRFELYAEPPDDSAPGSRLHQDAGIVQRTIERLRQRWHDAVHAATHDAHWAAETSGRVSRARDWTVLRIAESIAEQRTLWSRRGVSVAVMHFPSHLSEASAVQARDTLLSRARRHHRIRLLANLVAVVLTAVLMVLPGPNLIGYYFVFRVAGHFLSWRGAKQGRESIVWRASPEAALTELGALAQLPREQRADRVAAIAAVLGLPRLTIFF